MYESVTVVEKIIADDQKAIEYAKIEKEPPTRFI
jgi:hypothetical protein